MSRKHNPVAGIKYLFDGFALIRQPGIRKYIILPTLLNTLLFCGFAFLLFGPVADLISQSIAGLPQWLQWLDWLVYPLIVIALLLVIFYFFTLLANLLCAPFNGPLAQAVEYHLTGKQLEEESWGELIRGLPKVFSYEWQKFRYSAVRLVIVAPFLLVPGINFVASLVWAILGAWLLAIQYLEYPLSNHALPFKQQLTVIKQHRGLVLGFGIGVMFCTLIPVINLIIVPVAVAGASKMVVDSFPELLIKHYSPTEVPDHD